MDTFTLMCILISAGLFFIAGMMYGAHLIRKEAMANGCATYNRYINYFEWKKPSTGS